MEGSKMSKDVSIELIDCTNVILDEIKDIKFKRKNIAKTYALAIKSSEDSINWKIINEAIINRWSRSGLEYIKNLAWSGKCFI